VSEIQPAVALLIARLHDSYLRIATRYDLPEQDCEIWINPRDRDLIGTPGPHDRLFAMPVHVSIAIPTGEVAIFDRLRMEYRRDPAHIFGEDAH